LKLGLIGLLQSGKSTLLSALSGKAVPPVGSVSIEQAVVSVPDERIEWLSKLYNPKKKAYATIECLDIPGFSFAEESSRAAARKLINQIRTVDMLVLVIRAFESSTVPAYNGKVDPQRDLLELKTEILLSDLELVANRVEKLEKEIKKPSKRQGQDKAELDLMLKFQAALEEEKPMSTVVQSEEELELIRSFGFLTLKPMMAVINIGEKQIGQDIKLDTDMQTISLSAEIECELSQLDADSRVEFMKDLGITESAALKFVESCYSTLGLISFLTSGPDECRAWTIKKGTTAVDAAGKIHSDIKRGFIRAETISYADINALGDEKAVKAAGKARLEGKNYIVQDGDIINFRFNV
jgi:GTP-binding protein YchF